MKQTCLDQHADRLLVGLRAAFTYLDKRLRLGTPACFAFESKAPAALLRPCEVIPRLTLALLGIRFQQGNNRSCATRPGQERSKKMPKVVLACERGAATPLSALMITLWPDSCLGRAACATRQPNRQQVWFQQSSSFKVIIGRCDSQGVVLRTGVIRLVRPCHIVSFSAKKRFVLQD